RELHSLRRRFLQHVSDRDYITRDEFAAIPSVNISPLRDRLMVCFGFHQLDWLPFRDFAEAIAPFNNPSAPADQKLRVAFQLQDFDDDGELSATDVRCYLERIITIPEGAEIDLEAVAARIIQEACTNPAQKAITQADFSRVMQGADLRLYIPL
ncbi:hypothetical protein JKP88DRAFT_319337, partial [Tribonema minus]